MSAYADKRFLVVDDQPLARDSLRAIAQTVGAFAVEFASNYQDALYRIRNNAPDIVLCDYMLGEGRSGQQLLEELRRFNLLSDDTIFMMVTGEQAYEQVVAAVELVPDDYIIKPFSPDKLLLRLDRIVAKKKFFAAYYREKRRQDYAAALAVLAHDRDSKAGRPYRFEILRQEAETHLAAGDASAAEAAYRNILADYEFPWARAGVARSLHRQQKHTEARAEIELVVAGTPSYFDASDLKASICMAQGEHAEAQKVLDEIARKTPRNFLRKRLLAQAAALNGDTETARAAMAEVIANDTMPGAVSPQDQLTLVRNQVAAGDLVAAEKLLLGLRESDVKGFDLALQASYVALLAVASPERGKSRLAGLRPALIDTELPTDTRLDVLRAALATDDGELADRQARHLMAGHDAKKVFATVRKYYSLHGREMALREIQRQVALERIHHETPTGEQPPE